MFKTTYYKIYGVFPQYIQQKTHTRIIEQWDLSLSCWNWVHKLQAFQGAKSIGTVVVMPVSRPKPFRTIRVTFSVVINRGVPDEEGESDNDTGSGTSDETPLANWY